MPTDRIDRRTVLKYGGVTGLGALAGCLGDDEPEDGGDDSDAGTGDDTDDTDDTPAGDTSDGGTLRIALEEDPPTMDPYQISTVVGWNISYNINETLLTLQNGDLTGLLLEDWELVDDGTTAELTLKEGVQFHHDYGEMTAEDVAYSFEQMRKPGGSAESDYALVEDAVAVDDYFVRVDLEDSFGPFVPYMARVGFMISSKDAIEDQGTEVGDFQEPVGTGPFQLEEYTPDDRMVLSAFDDYHEDGVPHVDEIEFTITPDQDSRTLALQNDDVDFSRRMSYQDGVNLEEEEGTKVISDTAAEWGHLHINVDREPWDNPAVRRAVAHILDRQAVVDAALFGYGDVTDQPFPPDSQWFTDVDNQRTRDWDRAQEILDEAGNPLEDETLEIKATSAYRIHEGIAEILQANLIEFGIDAEIVNVDYGTLIDDFLETNYGITAFKQPAKIDPDRYYYTHIGDDTYTNYGPDQPDGERMRELIEEGRTEADIERRQELYGELHELINENVPWISVCYINEPAAMQEHVQGYEPWFYPYDRYKNMWLDS